MSKRVVRNHDLRREIAEYILSCSMDELLAVVCALETDTDIPIFFECDKCKKMFGACPLELDDGATLEVCKSRILQYEEMRDNG